MKLNEKLINYTSKLDSVDYLCVICPILVDNFVTGFFTVWYRIVDVAVIQNNSAVCLDENDCIYAIFSYCLTPHTRT